MNNGSHQKDENQNKKLGIPGRAPRLRAAPRHGGADYRARKTAY